MPSAKVAKPRPVHEVRLGRIKAAVWANETETGVRHNVTVGRLYVDPDTNKWTQTASFGRDDIPLVIKVLDRAHNWIFEQRQESNGQVNGKSQTDESDDDADDMVDDEAGAEAREEAPATIPF